MEKSVNLRNRIALSMIRNINLDSARELLDRVGSEDALFANPTESIVFRGSENLKHLTDTEYRKQLVEKAKTEEVFLMANNIKPLYFADCDYPERLLNCSDAPPMLYRLGETNLNAKHVVSIVGTRRATPAGIDITGRIVKDLSERLDDLVIVSGLAYGIDVAAHKAALANDVPTIAVTAHPLNTIYPAEHRGVAVNMIKSGGALITEYPSSSDVHKGNFLARNRIIAGVADVTIVVESDSRGGALVTARIAQEYNREVFAVPGRLTDKYSQGTLALISSNRAHIYINSDDLINEMGWNSKAAGPQQLTLAVEMEPDEQQIHDFLIAHPASSIYDIINGVSFSAGKVRDLLFSMEMTDLVTALPGGRYSAI